MNLPNPPPTGKSGDFVDFIGEDLRPINVGTGRGFRKPNTSDTTGAYQLASTLYYTEGRVRGDVPIPAIVLLH